MIKDLYNEYIKKLLQFNTKRTIGFKKKNWTEDLSQFTKVDHEKQAYKNAQNESTRECKLKPQ